MRFQFDNFRSSNQEIETRSLMVETVGSCQKWRLLQRLSGTCSPSRAAHNSRLGV